MNPRVHVLLPVHNRRAVTEDFIRCLAAQTWRGFHLVLIDDGCTDATVEMVLEYLPASSVLRGSGNWWWAGSLQQGYRWLERSDARSDDLVLIINDDTTFESDFLEAAVKALAGRERALLLAQLYSHETGKFVEIGVHADWGTLSFRGVDDPALVNCFSTRGLFLRVADMFDIGGFHPVLLPHYGSDYEYTMRAGRKGYAFISSPQVKVWYKEHSTGIRELTRQSIGRFLRTAFSKRALYNPIYWSSFVLLSSPPRYIAINLYRVWTGFFRETRKALF